MQITVICFCLSLSPLKNKIKRRAFSTDTSIAKFAAENDDRERIHQQK
jgi:hypothetical protein